MTDNLSYEYQGIILTTKIYHKIQYEKFHNLYTTTYFTITLSRFQNRQKLRDQIFGTVNFGRTEFSSVRKQVQ